MNISDTDAHLLTIIIKQRKIYLINYPNDDYNDLSLNSSVIFTSQQMYNKWLKDSGYKSLVRSDDTDRTQIMDYDQLLNLASYTPVRTSENMVLMRKIFLIHPLDDYSDDSPLNTSVIFTTQPMYKEWLKDSGYKSLKKYDDVEKAEVLQYLLLEN